MWRYVVGICLSFILVSNSASAALMLSLEGLPSTYEPGDSFSFRVKLSGAEDLNTFGIMLVMTAEQGTPGDDFLFVGADEPDPGYVFAGEDRAGFDGTPSFDENAAFMYLSDFLDNPDEFVTTEAGENDVVAIVTVVTTRNVGGLKIAFDADLLELYSPDGFVDGFAGLVDELASATPTSISPSSVNPIPEPSTWTMALLLGTLIIGGRRLGLGRARA